MLHIEVKLSLCANVANSVKDGLAAWGWSYVYSQIKGIPKNSLVATPVHMFVHTNVLYWCWIFHVQLQEVVWRGIPKVERQWASLPQPVHHDDVMRHPRAPDQRWYLIHKVQNRLPDGGEMIALSPGPPCSLSVLHTFWRATEKRREESLGQSYNINYHKACTKH